MQHYKTAQTKKLHNPDNIAFPFVCYILYNILINYLTLINIILEQVSLYGFIPAGQVRKLASVLIRKETLWQQQLWLNF